MFSNLLNVLRVKPQFLLSGSGVSVIRLWDVSTGTLVREMNHHRFESIVAVSTNWETMQAYSISKSTELIHCQYEQVFVRAKPCVSVSVHDSL
jgi:WD40 repeat protein